MMRKFHKVPALLAVAAIATSMTLPAGAQVASLEAQYETFSASDPTADDLAALATDSPNLFVFAVESMLVERGAFAGPPTGILTQASIGRINAFCAEAGIIADCQLGPLGETGSTALASALLPSAPPAASVPMAADPEAEAGPVAAEMEAAAPLSDAAAVPTEAVESVAAEAAQPAAAGEAATSSSAVPLAAYWLPAIRDGLETEVVRGGADQAGPFEIRIFGTANADGYSNINMTRVMPTEVGERWTFSTEAAVTAGSVENLGLEFRVALRSANDFVGDLVPGGTSMLSAAEGRQTFVLEGVVAEPLAVAVQPFVHLRYTEGATIDVTLELTPPIASKSQGQ